VGIEVPTVEYVSRINVSKRNIVSTKPDQRFSDSTAGLAFVPSDKRRSGKKNADARERDL
jgi:hypothetical protein